ncbi:hypothetical protein ARTHRO9V_100162 [Arthrobacter sp. 9V]|nr:hypothetical protein ARTHRO9V_100162 [Arthrobacter sp. 9V]
MDAPPITRETEFSDGGGPFGGASAVFYSAKLEISIRRNKELNNGRRLWMGHRTCLSLFYRSRVPALNPGLLAGNPPFAVGCPG